ncbi:MAG: sulfate transporter, partial [Planctomycetota bacterium]
MSVVVAQPSAAAAATTAAQPVRPLPLRFTARELAGGLGDLGTFLPIAVALAAAARMDLAAIFLFAGLMNIATGLLFRLPVPVQPMKAVAAVAIAEGLTSGEVAAAGLGVAAVVTALALSGGVDWISRVVPRPVIRGVQAGVGAKLALKGLAWTGALPLTGLDSALTAVIVALTIATLGRRLPVILPLFLAGLGLAAATAPIDGAALFAAPAVQLQLPAGQEWTTGLARGALPQLPLTLLNSVLAVCALSGDLFPGRAIPTRTMALSVGLMNLLCAPFGAMPMCHGAGGLAAQHRFGARTGGSVVMLGAGKIVLALALGAALLPLAQAFPRSILA